MSTRRTWSKLILVVVALLCVSAVATAHRRGWGWWHRPDSDPIPNVVFSVDDNGGVETEDGIVKVIEVDDWRVTSKEVFELEDTAFNGGVVDGEVRFREFTLRGAGGDPVQVVVNLEFAELHENYFNSKFWSEGTATVTAFIDGDRVTREVPVSVHGSVREDDGEIKLWAQVRGVLNVENDDDDDDESWRWRRYRRHRSVSKTITVFKVELEAEAEDDDDNGPA